MFVWDEAKNAANLAKHGIAFAEALAFDPDSVAYFDRTRKQDGETRYAAIGYLRGKLHTMIYTLRGDDVRIISLRRSNTQEERSYEKIIRS